MSDRANFAHRSGPDTRVVVSISGEDRESSDITGLAAELARLAPELEVLTHARFTAELESSAEDLAPTLLTMDHDEAIAAADAFAARYPNHEQVVWERALALDCGQRIAAVEASDSTRARAAIVLRAAIDYGVIRNAPIDPGSEAGELWAQFETLTDARRSAADVTQAEQELFSHLPSGPAAEVWSQSARDEQFRRLLDEATAVDPALDPLVALDRPDDQALLGGGGGAEALAQVLTVVLEFGGPALAGALCDRAVSVAADWLRRRKQPEGEATEALVHIYSPSGRVIREVRVRREDSESSLASYREQLRCPHCGRTLRSASGLNSHIAAKHGHGRT